MLPRKYKLCKLGKLCFFFFCFFAFSFFFFLFSFFFFLFFCFRHRHSHPVFSISPLQFRTRPPLFRPRSLAATNDTNSLRVRVISVRIRACWQSFRWCNGSIPFQKGDLFCFCTVGGCVTCTVGVSLSVPTSTPSFRYKVCACVRTYVRTYVRTS